jgi:hypothetical protein
MTRPSRNAGAITSAGALPVALDVLWRDDHHVDRAAGADQAEVNLFGQLSAVVVAWLDDQQVEVAA